MVTKTSNFVMVVVFLGLSRRIFTPGARPVFLKKTVLPQNCGIPRLPSVKSPSLGPLFMFFFEEIF